MGFWGSDVELLPSLNEHFDGGFVEFGGLSGVSSDLLRFFNYFLLLPSVSCAVPMEKYENNGFPLFPYVK